MRRDALDADGIICDIGRSLDLLKTALAEFDYRSLDEFAEFRGRNTTSIKMQMSRAQRRALVERENPPAGRSAEHTTQNRSIYTTMPSKQP